MRTKLKCLWPHCFTLAFAMIGAVTTSSAALREWTGERNLDNTWTQSQNWSPGAPVAGDDLLFPTFARHPQNQNNYPGDTTFNSIELRGGGPWGGYNIGGNPIALNAGIKVENNSGGPVDHTINNGLMLNSNQTFTVNNDVGSFQLTGPINLNGKIMTVDVIASISTLISGSINGAGGLVKTGSGPLTLSGANNYTGQTTVSGGILRINGSQPFSAVQLVSGTLGGTGAAGTITAIGSGGPGSIVLSPGASPGILTCSNTALNSSTAFSVELNGTTPGTGYDQLNVTGTVNLGGASLSLSVGFGPAVGNSFLIVVNDGVDPVTGTFSGLSEGTVLLVGTNAFQISYLAGSGNDVSLTKVVPPPLPVTRIWDGGGTDSNWMTPANWSGDSAPATGDNLIFPMGPSKLVMTNNYPVGNTVNSIVFSNGGYVLRGARIALNAGLIADHPSGLVDLFTPFTLVSNQTFFARTGSLFLNAATDLAGNTLTFWTDSEIQTAQPGTILGGGTIIKAGPGILTFGGSHSYTGLTEIREGTLHIITASGLGTANSGTIVSNGASLTAYGGQTITEPLELYGRLQTSPGNGTTPSTWTGAITLGGPGAQISTPSSGPLLTISGVISGSGSLTKAGSGDVVITATNTYSGSTTNSSGRLFMNGLQPQSAVVLVSGVLGGTGTVGTVQATASGSKTLSPGGPSLQHGILNSSNLTLSASTIFHAHLNGNSPGTGYDQLVVNGTVGVGNAGLVISLGFNPGPGNAFTIIANDGNDPVQGTFNGLPEGATLTANGKTFQISYTGGTGNDVVLTLYSLTPGFASITRSGNGHMALQSTGGIPGLVYDILAATNPGTSVSWSNIGSAVANGSGDFSFTDSNAPLFLKRFYRSRSP